MCDIRWIHGIFVSQRFAEVILIINSRKGNDIMSYESEMKSLREEEKRRGLAILRKYYGKTPPGVLDNPDETREFSELRREIFNKRNAIFKKYGKPCNNE